MIKSTIVENVAVPIRSALLAMPKDLEYLSGTNDLFKYDKPTDRFWLVGDKKE